MILRAILSLSLVAKISLYNIEVKKKKKICAHNRDRAHIYLLTHEHFSFSRRIGCRKNRKKLSARYMRACAPRSYKITHLYIYVYYKTCVALPKVRETAASEIIT